METTMETIEQHHTPDFAHAFHTEPASLPPLSPSALGRLVKRHGQLALANFYAEHADLFAQSRVFVDAGDDAAQGADAARAALDRLGLQHRRVYALQHQAYFFLAQEDEPLVRQDAGFLMWYGRGVMAINSCAGPTKKPKSKPRIVEVDAKKSPSRALPLKRPRHLAPPPSPTHRNTDLVTMDNHNAVQLMVRETQQQLALAQELRQEQEKRHTLELQLERAQAAQRESELRAEYQERELALMRQYQPQPQLALTAQQPRYRLNSLDDWIRASNPLAKAQRVQLQQLAQRQLPRHHQLWENPQITRPLYDCLVQRIGAPETDARGLLRLAVPLTYSYRLRDVLRALRDRCPALAQSQAQFTVLLERCPSEYRVVLQCVEWPHPMQMMDAQQQAQQLQVCERINRVNLSVLVVHCQAAVLAHHMNRQAAAAGPDATEKKSVLVTLCARQHALETAPCPDLMEHYYPGGHLGHYGGPNTYVTAYMGLRVDSPTFARCESRVKTGGGKRCKFCWTRDRILGTTANDYQFTHQMRTCPVLFNLSQNEAVVLAVLLAACTKSPGNEVRAAALTSKSKRVFLFGEADSVVREATQEEWARGEHVGGARLNRKPYGAMSADVFKLLEHQLKGQIGHSERRPVFGAIEPSLYFLADRLVAGDVKTATLASLLQDAHGEPFVMRKRPVDELYFSLQRLPSVHAQRDAQYQEWQRGLQQHWITNYAQGNLY